MADNLSSIYAKLSLNDEEKIEISADSLSLEDFDGSNFLVGRVLVPWIINFDSISSMFKRLWNPRHGLSCKPLGDNTVLFMFKNAVDMKKVLNGSPWLFDKSLLALTEADASQIGSNIEVTTCQFWVQIHDLPIGLMNRVFAKTSGDTIGKFLEVDVDSDGCSFGRFLRIRVEMDITKPLRRVVKTSFRGTEFVLPIKYERLPNFCYFCGVIGHGEKDCDARILNPPDSSFIPPYGSWLRAVSTGNPFSNPRTPPSTNDNTTNPNPNPPHANPIPTQTPTAPSNIHNLSTPPSHTATLSHETTSEAPNNTHTTDPITESSLIPISTQTSPLAITRGPSPPLPSSNTHRQSHNDPINRPGDLSQTPSLPAPSTVPLLTNTPHINPSPARSSPSSTPPHISPEPSHITSQSSLSSPFLVPVHMELDTPARKIA
ncbi:hypothetical protein DH2020_009154 [Rehmannia glutinosa]|uniref:CCHC-type domain-containing protein n=1 Tax=Rehmannia glutinosa TaxID=99300 RepID=A0ABR0X814_REHGL